MGKLKVMHHWFFPLTASNRMEAGGRRHPEIVDANRFGMFGGIGGRISPGGH